MLKKEEIKDLISDQSLIKGFPDLDTQLQKNGFNLTVGEIFEFEGVGDLDFSNNERKFSKLKKIEPKKKDDKYGWWNLDSGTYKIVANESIKLPEDISAIAFPRNSIIKMGASTHQSNLEPGFKGKPEFLLDVGNKNGINIKENGRISKLIFIKK